MARVEKNYSLEALRLLFPLNNGVLFRRFEEQGAGTWESSPNTLFRETSNAFPTHGGSAEAMELQSKDLV